MIPIVFGVMLITFVLFRVVGGDVSAEIAGKGASAKVIAEIRHEYGWDKPLFFNRQAWSEKGWRGALDTQFFDHFRRCVTGDFGNSIRHRRPISQIIWEGAPASLSLTVPMFFVGLLVELSLSLWAAYRRGMWYDRILMFLCVLGMSLPYLSFILVGQYIFGYRLNWFPVFGYESGWAAAQYVVLPAMIGIISGLGSEVRLYRTMILDEVNADYVRTARAKGVGTGKLLFKHVLKNAMIPVITRVVLAIPYLFMGSLLLERFFGIPGLGYLTIEAISSRDYPIINAMTYIGAILYVIGVIMTDICYALVDPRIRLGNKVRG